jgi:hypothetical protein
MKTITRAIPVIVAGFFAAFLCCTTAPQQYSGGGSDTEISGLLVTVGGEPALYTQVTVLPADYNPVTGQPNGIVAVDTTDANGRYAVWIKAPVSGTYSIQALHLVTRERALITGISVDPRRDNTLVPTAQLTACGAIKIIPDSVDTGSGYYYIPGSLFYGAIRGGSALIDSVPAGLVQSVNYGGLNTNVQKTVRKDVAVAAGDTISVRNLAWLFARYLFVNTTSSGAQVSGAATGFPVLIRLSGANFDFSRADRNGSDLRFTKENGEFLPYEIEQWDSAAGLADVWMHADTVYGNDDTHAIVMYWGNPSAVSTSNSAAVFDSSEGFLSVWHLDETANTQAGGYKDATVQGNNLTAAAAGAIGNGDGVIGPCRSFDTTANYLAGALPARIGGSVSFTITFWLKTGLMRSGTSQLDRVDILDFGQKGTPKSAFHMLLWPNYITQFGFEDPVTDTMPDTSLKVAQNVFSFSAFAGTWTQVATVYDASAGTISTYVNGTLADRDSVSGINIIAASGLRIGMPYYSGEAQFNGSIDELRIMAGAMNDQVIKLNYESQKPGSGVVIFR